LILLSNTTQAMSAILGGCNTLITNVHEENSLGTRIARNVSNILKEESHFDKVADVSAGSYYIETLTDKIAEAIWTKFAQ
jgi:methylmalonyl-CoA mutase